VSFQGKLGRKKTFWTLPCSFWGQKLTLTPTPEWCKS